MPPGGHGALQAFLADGPVQHARFRLLSSDLRALDLGEVTEPARLAAVFDEIRAYFLTQSGSPRTRLTGYSVDHAASKACWKRHCDAVKAIAPAIKQALDAWARDLNVMLARGVQRMFAVALREYRQTLAEHEVLDFADVLGRAVDLLRQMDEFSQSRYRLESRYHHVLVDEFQDTSRMQWELVSLLVASWGEGFGLVHEAPLPPSLFVVGDRKQSIYRFRDADVSLLDDAARAITALRPDGPVRRVISRSFRSVPALLALVNDLCGAMPESTRGDAFRYDEGDRFPLEGLADPFEAAPLSITMPSPHSRLRPAPLGVVVGDSIEACAASVADEISRLLAEGIVRDRDTGVAREARPGDIAILFRSRDSHREFEHALEARGLPSYVYKGLGFFDADEIKDLSALMRYLAAPESNLRAAAFLRSRFVRLSDTALRELGHDLAAVLAPSVTAAAEGANEAEVRLSEEDRGVLARLRASLPEWLALVDRLPPAELIDHILASSSYGLEIGGRQAIDEREPLRQRGAQTREHPAILFGQLPRPACGERAGVRGRAGGDSRCQHRRQLWPQLTQRSIRQPHEPRSQERRRAQIRFRRGEIAHQRRQILDLVGVEEAQSLVDVGRQPARFERLLELAMRIARAEQDRDVARPRLARDAGIAIAHDAFREQPRDLVSHRCRARFDRVADDDAERRRTQAVVRRRKPRR